MCITFLIAKICIIVEIKPDPDEMCTQIHIVYRTLLYSGQRGGGWWCGLSYSFLRFQPFLYSKGLNNRSIIKYQKQV